MYATNHVPPFGKDTSLTHCCPRFDPAGWDGQTFTFKNKPFVKMITRSIFYAPLNMSSMIAKTWQKIQDSGADDKEEYVMMTHDVSPWKAEHYIWVDKPVAGADNVDISGTFTSKVFEGPYREAGKWYRQLLEDAKAKGQTPKKIYFYYSTCPKCSKVYGKNYVVGLVQVS